MVTRLPINGQSQERQPFIPASDRIYGAIGNLVIALTLVGYPLSASLSQFLDQADSNFNIFFRVIHLIISLYFILMTWNRKNFTLDILISVFFLLYIIRLWWDLNYSFLPDIAKDFQFFIAVTLVPVIAMAGSRKWFNERLCTLFIAAIGGVGGLFIAYNLSVGSALATAPELSQRASLELLNPISIGYHGLFITSAATILLARYRTVVTMTFAIPVAVLGIYLLIEAGSRGPFVALLTGLIITGFANNRVNVAYAVGTVVALAIISASGVPDLILGRFLESGQDASSLERIYTLELSIQQVLENPLAGSAYIEPITGRYPHNLVVEGGLAIGIAGMVFIGWMQISLLLNAWRAARTGQWFVPFVAGAMLANAWISGSLWGSALFFMMLWILHAMPKQETAKVSPVASGRIYQ